MDEMLIVRRVAVLIIWASPLVALLGALESVRLAEREHQKLIDRGASLDLEIEATRRALEVKFRKYPGP